MENIEKLTVLLNEINGQYNKKELTDWLQYPFLQFIKERADFLLENEAPESYVEAGLAKNGTKEVLCGVAVVPFFNKTIFEAFREWLSDDVNKVLEALVWEESLHRDEIQKRLKINVCEEVEKYGRIQLVFKEKFKFLRMGKFAFWQDQVELKIFTSLRQVLVDYIKKPEEATIKFLDEIDATLQQYTSGEQDILFEMPRLVAYGRQKHIKVSMKGKPNQLSLGKMQRTLNLNEFYKNSDAKLLKTMRTHLLSSVLGNIHLSSKKIETPKFIQSIFSSYYIKTYHSFFGLVNYLKGTGQISEWYVRRSEEKFYNFGRKLEVGKWVAVENIAAYFKFNMIEINVISAYTAESKLYYEYDSEGKSGKQEYIDSELFHDVLVLPVIKGTMFLFAAFGLLDIAYDEVDVSVLGKTCMSPFDALRYIRLTPLGSYVFQLSEEYKAPEVTSKSTLKLSEDSLTIIAAKSDANAAMLLKPYAEKISPNRYRTDNNFFLKNCKTKKELEDKIKLFQQIIGTSVPAYWENFFKELLRKIDPLEVMTDMFVYKIPKENKNLVNLIARDPYLKKYCLKAEGFHILVKKNHLGKVKKRLGEFGYLLTIE